MTLVGGRLGFSPGSPMSSATLRYIVLVCLSNAAICGTDVYVRCNNIMVLMCLLNAAIHCTDLLVRRSNLLYWCACQTQQYIVLMCLSHAVIYCADVFLR